MSSKNTDHPKKAPEREVAEPTSGDELELMKRELDEAKKQIDETKDKLLRAAADFENAKKRLQKEKHEFVNYANETFLRGLLPILDNFDRAIAHAEAEDPSPSSFRDGIRLIRKQLFDFLQSEGVEYIEAVGKSFDPHFHEAIGQVPSDEHPDDTVLEELEAGYLLRGRLLRPAKVRITRKSAGGDAGAAN